MSNSQPYTSGIETRYFVLSSHCKVTIGATRSLLTDFQRQKLHSLSNTYGRLLQLMNRSKLTDVLSMIEEDDRPQLNDFLSFLLAEEIGFLTETPEQFPEASPYWDYPGKILNSILDFNGTRYNYKKAIRELHALNCKNIQLRFFSPLAYEQLQEILEAIKHTGIVYTEVLLPASQNWGQPHYEALFHEFGFLSIIYVYSAGENRVVEVTLETPGSYPVQFGKLIYSSDHIVSEKSCGIICHDNMNYLSLYLFNEMREHNGCLNRKISVSQRGEIKNCPSMPVAYGHINTTSLLEVIEQEEFTRWFRIKKDDIAVCRDCEYRYNCTDCRAYLEDPHNAFSKPLKCGYNPYTGIWDDWTANPLRQETIQHYGLQTYLPLHETPANS